MSSFNGGDGDDYSDHRVFNDLALIAITGGNAALHGEFLPRVSSLLSTLFPGKVNGIWTLKSPRDASALDTGTIDFLGFGLYLFSTIPRPVSSSVLDCYRGERGERWRPRRRSPTSRWRNDDGGFRNLTLVGADAAYFQIIGKRTVWEGLVRSSTSKSRMPFRSRSRSTIRRSEAPLTR